MSDLDIAALLQTLKGFPEGTPLSEVLAKILPEQPPDVAEALKRCALVRWFDRSVFDLVCEDLEHKPDFKMFVDRAEVRRLRPDRWSIDDRERTRLLAEWQSNPEAWKRWNKKLGDYFAAKEGPEAELTAVYHLAASPAPSDVIPIFRKSFDKANDAFDMAQCNALLEMLRVQESWRGSQVSNLWRASRQYYAARVLFLDDYYKTGSYFERPELFAEFSSVLNRKPGDGRWIFHLHATGGSGKTMFLRWLTARYLVPGKILCARLDFDDFRLDEVVDFPLRLFSSMVEQFTRQPNGEALTSLLEKLRLEERNTGWNPDVMAEIQRQLRGAHITTPVVVMLDTLEEATLSAATWLERCVREFRSIQVVCPNLTLVLSGRYDIAAQSRALVPGEFLSYDLPRFSEAEAHRYLEQRGIECGPVRDAIVERAEADEDPGEETGASDHRLSGRNPFKLAMFAELRLNRPTLTPDEVRRFPRADIAYLIERVIKRIAAQPLRWMIRYGATARQLTLEFAQAVLLPPLLKALRGEQADNPGRGLEDYISPGSLDDEKTDVWKQDPEAVAALEQGGMNDLWDKLSAYARDRGWLTSAVVDGQPVLRFHPEVVNPTRELLREQAVFGELQDRATAFFEAKAGSEQQAKLSVRSIREAVFHRFQRDGGGALQFWIANVRKSADRFGPAAAVPVASEILGRDYAEAERIPYPRVSSPGLLIAAHCEAADLLMQAAGLVFSEPRSRNNFNRHVELAVQIAGDNPGLPDRVPAYLEQIFRAWRLPSLTDTAGCLQAAIPQANDPRERLLLQLQLCQTLLLQASPEAPRHLREAVQLLPNAERTGVVASDLYLALANHYVFIGAHTAVIEAMNSAARSAEGMRSRAQVLNHKAWYAMGVGDISTAEKRLAEIRRLPAEALPSSTSPLLLEGGLAIVDLDPIAARRASEQGLASTTIEIERARCLDQHGEAQAQLFEFRAALNDWDSASTKYDLAASAAGPARCALLSARLKARVMGDYRDAETRIASALSLRGSGDIEIHTELGLLQAFVLSRTNRREQARAVVAELRNRPEIPPRIHARVLVFTLVFGLQEATGKLLEDVEETISQIQPISLKDSVLDWIEYADGGIDVPPKFLRRLVGQLARPGLDSPRATGLLILRSDLYRVFGMFREAAAQLDLASIGWSKQAGADSDRANDSRLLLLAWQLNLARKRLGEATAFGTLLERFRASELGACPLYGALVGEAASEAARAGETSAALQLLDAYTPPDDELPSVWQLRSLALQAELAPPQSRNRLQRLVADLYRAFGQTPPDAGDTTGGVAVDDDARTAAAMRVVKAVAISGNDLPPALGTAPVSPGTIIDMISGDSFLFADALRNVLRRRNAEDAPIEPSKDVAALPWELGGALYRQSSSLAPRPYLAEDRLRPGAIQLLMPAGSEDDLSFAATSGSSLEEVYGRHGIRPTVVHVSKVSFEVFFSGPPPALLHIVAAVRDGSEGPYLDFASTTHRIESVESGSGYEEARMTASFLSRLLIKFPQPPFVILDIAHPYNRAEAVRMLLLRNLFATELYEYGNARGVLACGLAAPNDRLSLASIIFDALLAGPVTAPILRLRYAPGGNLDHVMSHHGAALWTNNPEDRLFTP